MNSEQLAAGTEISNKINEFKEHLETISRLDATEEKKCPRLRDKPLTLHYWNQGGGANSLELLPGGVNMEEFLLLYKSKIQAKIAYLEKCFAAL